MATQDPSPSGEPPQRLTCTDGEPGPTHAWEARYQQGNTPWDLGQAPPCLETLLDGLGSKALRVLVPGAGTGHDALAWARRGHQVTAVDIAPSAVAALRRLAAAAGLSVEAREADLLDLPPALEGAFDVVWEQTCFCALAPDQRASYVASMASALVAGGRLHGLFWQHGMEAGPPWNVTPEDVRASFDEAFALEQLTRVQVSAGTRSNEFLVVLRKRSLQG